MRRSVALAVACVLLFSACASTPPAQPSPPKNVKQWIDQQSRAKKGAMVGALAGALAGALVAKQLKTNVFAGAAAGGFVGGMAGFFIGRSRDRLLAQRDAAIRTANYDPRQGYLARVEVVRFDPPQPRPGLSANLCVRYLVVGPDPGESIRVRLFRGIRYGDTYILGLGPNEFTVPRGGGIVDSVVAVTLPANVPQGTYGLEALLDDPRGRFPEAIRSNPLLILAQVRTPGAGELLSQAPGRNPREPWPWS